MRSGSNNGYDQCRAIIVRVRWYAAIRRGILATFDNVYRDTRGNDRQVKRAQHPKPDITIRLTVTLLSELANIVSIPRFAPFHVNEGIRTTTMASDDSVTTVVVTFSYTNATEAGKIWKIAIKQKLGGDMAPRHDAEVE